MDKLYIPLLLLNLTKNETQLLLWLFLIYESDEKKEAYDIKKLASAISLSQDVTVDTLNKLVMRNIVGKITMSGVVTPTVKEDFDNDFLAILYDKKNSLASAKQKAGFVINNCEVIYVLNVVIKSWRYLNKTYVVKVLKKLTKQFPNDTFITYLLEGYNNGKKGGKRLASIKRVNNSWDVANAVKIFRREYEIKYGSTYHLNTKRDYSHMKIALTQLANNNVPRENLAPFIKYAFDGANNKDYVLSIAGLKYYTNNYSATGFRNKARN